jgi:hypothetical protein
MADVDHATSSMPDKNHPTAVKRTELVAWLFVSGLLVVYVVLFAAAPARFSLWSPYTPAVDEMVQLYQGGRNFAQRGFTVDWLLPDLSTSASPLYYPHLYNHQPPGPQLAIGILMRLFGENYWLIRSAFATMFFIGLVCYVLVARTIVARAALGGQLALFVIAPVTILRLMDHPVYSLFPLCAFFPLLALHRYHESGKRVWLVAAAGVVFVASNYLIYGPLIMILVWWALGVGLRLIPMRRRELLLACGLVAAGVFLHLLQTVLVVGWSMFAKEIWFTLSNRATGFPTHEALRALYERLGFVLFGGHVFSPERFKHALWLAFWFPGRLVVAGVFGALVLVSLGVEAWSPRERRGHVFRDLVQWAANVTKIGLWTGAAIIVPLMMFPAYASDYGLYGTSEFLLAIFVAFAVGIAFRFIRNASYPGWTQRVLFALLMIAMLWIVNVQARSFATLARGTGEWMMQSPAEEGFAWIAEHLRGEVVMTNVDPIVVGFFTRESAYGGCHRESLPLNGPEAERCFVRSFRTNRAAGLPIPRAFVWYGFGQAFCRGDDCIALEEIAQRYPTLFETKRMAVFDVTQTERQSVR